MAEMARAHLVVPKHLIDEIDSIAGSRQRSQFIVAAIENELRRRRLLAAFDEFAGSLKNVDVPGWETAESTAGWVRDQRRGWRDPWLDDRDEPAQ